MKKVCFVAGQFPVKSQTFVINQIVETIKNKFDVTVLTYQKFPVENSSQKEIVNHFKLYEIVNEIDFKIPKNSFIKFCKYVYAGLKNINYIIRCRKLINPLKIEFFKKFNHIDVFHVHFGEYALDVALMKKIGVLKMKLIVTFHGYDAHYKDDDDKNKLKQQYEDLFLIADVITVNTLYLKQLIIDLGGIPERIKIIPMGVDVDFFKVKKPRIINLKNTIELISVGRLIELKGFQYSIQAIKKVLDKGYKINYTIIGFGRFKLELQELINNLNLNNNVFLVGSKNQNEILKYFKKAHVFLMSSITDSSGRCEAQGLVTVEAQASSLPVIAFDSGGVKYTLKNKETGFLIKEKDTEAYAATIIKLISNQQLYRSLAHEAEIFASKYFNLEITSKEMISLY